MAISLKKGGSIDLTKKDGGVLSLVTIGTGWKAPSVGYDLDASVYMLSNASTTVGTVTDPVPAPKKKSFFGKLFGGGDTAPATPTSRNVSNNDIVDLVKFGRLNSRDGSVRHHGDNLVGGDGVNDDERIDIKLAKVSPNIKRLVVGVNIYNPGSKHFGAVKNAYVRVFDTNTKDELVRYDLKDEFAGKKAIIVGALERTGNGWKFVAIGQGSMARNISSVGNEIR